MSVQLLDKTRKINKLLHNNNTSKVVFNDICEVLSEILESNILVLSKKGKVLGFSVWKDVDVINELAHPFPFWLKISAPIIPRGSMILFIGREFREASPERVVANG